MLERIIDVLTNPDLLRSEIIRFTQGRPNQQAKETELRRQLLGVQDREQRLARLFVDGELPEAVLQAEGSRLQLERKRTERELASIEQADLARVLRDELETSIPAIAERVRQWVMDSRDEELETLLSALDIKIVASRKRAVVDVSVPYGGASRIWDGKDLVTIERTSA